MSIEEAIFYGKGRRRPFKKVKKRVKMDKGKDKMEKLRKKIIREAEKMSDSEREIQQYMSGTKQYQPGKLYKVKEEKDNG